MSIVAFYYFWLLTFIVNHQGNIKNWDIMLSETLHVNNFIKKQIILTIQS